MVLSNKKLKQKLKEAKAEELAASELSQNKELKTPENPTAEAQESIQSLLKTVTQNPRLSKRDKRREKAKSLPEKVESLGVSDGVEVKKEGDKANSLQENVKSLGVSDGGEVKKEGDEGGVDGNKKEKKRKKRKREEGEGDESEEVKEAKMATNKKKKKKKKKKGKKKKVEDGEVKKEGVANGGGGNVEQGVVVESKTNDSKENLDACTKVYVGGIPYYSTEDDIRSYFEGCGTITEIDCMTFPESGKFRGIAIITFKTEAAAKRALALDGSDMGGLYLKIQPYKTDRVNKTSSFAPAIVEGYNRIYAGNLSWDITEDDLRKLFSHCTITSIRFGEDKETGEFKGYAHVDFADSLSVNMALKLDQKIVCGRPIKISCAVPKKGAVTNSQSTGVPTISQPVQQNTEVNSNEVTTVSSKIRRRTCYECGERGHLSSSCPKKQEADQANAVAS